MSASAIVTVVFGTDLSCLHLSLRLGWSRIRVGMVPGSVLVILLVVSSVISGVLMVVVVVFGLCLGTVAGVSVSAVGITFLMCVALLKRRSKLCSGTLLKVVSGSGCCGCRPILRALFRLVRC